MVLEPKPVRYAVAVFDDHSEIETTGNALRQLDQASLETALLACRSTFERTSTSRSLRKGDDSRPSRTANRQGPVSKREVGLDVPAGGSIALIEVGQVPPSKPILSSAGALADLLLHAGAEPGASIRPILQAWIPNKHSAFLEDQLGAGRILLWVHIQDADHEASVCRILLKHSPYRVQVYDLKSMPRDKPRAT